MFENFLYHTLLSIRNDQELSRKTVVVFMDNAKIHKHFAIGDTVRKMKGVLMFNCEYSPWLNPVEQWFRFLKRKTRE